MTTSEDISVCLLIDELRQRNAFLFRVFSVLVKKKKVLALGLVGRWERAAEEERPEAGRCDVFFSFVGSASSLVANEVCR